MVRLTRERSAHPLRLLTFAAVLCSVVGGVCAAPLPGGLRFQTIDGREAALSDYAGKVLLIVNVASKCGYTPQYAGLQVLHERYAERGLVVLAFPCDDFGGQEPGTEREIAAFCEAEYGVAFPMAAKVSVKGESAHAVYRHLTDAATNPRFHGGVRWNFEKFLVGRGGEVLNRFRSRVAPTSDEVIASVEWALADEAGRAAAYAKGGKGPPPVAEYRGREVARTMHWKGAPWLMREVREDEEKTSAMVRQLGLREGVDVADIGCGNGYHTLMMAERIGGGTAYAVDIQPEMLEMLEGRARKAGIDNIECVENRFWDTDLPEASIDLALLADVYHEFSHPEEMLASLRRALRPGGRLVLLEFREEDPRVPIKPEHKMSKAQVELELEANGFRLVGSYDELPWQHMMFFEAAPEPDADDS